MTVVTLGATFSRCLSPLQGTTPGLRMHDCSSRHRFAEQCPYLHKQNIRRSTSRGRPPKNLRRWRQMKIASWNDNDIVKRLPLVLEWLVETRPDVVALQETKTLDAAFPRAAIEAAGYGGLIAGQRPWNGVALLARGAEPIEIRRAHRGAYNCDNSDLRAISCSSVGSAHPSPNACCA